MSASARYTAHHRSTSLNLGLLLAFCAGACAEKESDVGSCYLAHIYVYRAIIQRDGQSNITTKAMPRALAESLARKDPPLIVGLTARGLFLDVHGSCGPMVFMSKSKSNLEFAGRSITPVS